MKVRKVAKFINSSEKRWDIFRDIQLDLAKTDDRTSFRPLRCFQDVRTRWDSTNQMLMRIRKLRPAVTAYSELDSSVPQLNEVEWRQIDYIITILRPFAVFTQLIGSTREPTIHRVLGVYSLLLDHLERCREQLKKKRKDWKILLYEALELATAKLNQYYLATEDMETAEVYGVAILLNPSAKDAFWKSGHWHEDEAWVSRYWVAFEEVYQDYRGRSVERRRVVPRKLQRRQEPSLDEIMDRIQSDQLGDDEIEADDADAELADYRQFSKFMVVFW